MIRVHFLIHVKYEDPGAIVSWCDEKGFKKSFTRFYEQVYFPDPDDFDMLVIMGGPMSVNDEDKFPWLSEEKNFIHNAIEQGKKVIGICLGAQLIASALGSKVEKNRYKEIGWHNVHFRPESLRRLPFLPITLNTFHWHGDTFDIPKGSETVGFSEATTNQGFLYNDNVVALQFHPEMTEKMILTLIDECRPELSEESKYIKDEDKILADIDNIKENNMFLINVLNYLSN